MYRTKPRGIPRVTVRPAAIAALVCGAILATAPAALGRTTTTSNVRAFTLGGSQTLTFEVAYPFALEYGNARYSCTASASGLGRKYVRIVRRGSALGGSVCRVTARNTAKLPSIDTTATVRVTASTSIPAASRTNVKSFTLGGSQTLTFQVPYPLALKYGQSRYGCSAGVSGLGRRYVRILSQRSAAGGSVCQVKARNTAKLPSIDTTATIRVTATTILPNG